MNWWQALILGIVEGVTEYLPVSSTGHLILTAWLLGFADDPAAWEAVGTFNIVIQAGAIAAVAGLYWPRIKQMTLGLLGRDAIGLRLAVNLIIAFLPAAMLGPLLHSRIEESLFRVWPVIGALFVGAWLMLAVARSHKLNRPRMHGADRAIDHMQWQTALLIGFGQCIAMWPGTSRSMMTIVTAMILGMRAKDAAEFSFLLGLITLTGATVYQAGSGGAQMLDQFGLAPLLIGFAAATISAAFAVKWLVGFLTRHGVGPFGWYRMALAGILAALILTGVAELGALEK